MLIEHYSHYCMRVFAQIFNPPTANSAFCIVKPLEPTDNYIYTSFNNQ
jgi:hypothetical protein